MDFSCYPLYPPPQKKKEGMSPNKMDHFKRKQIIFQAFVFRGRVGFRIDVPQKKHLEFFQILKISLQIQSNQIDGIRYLEVSVSIDGFIVLIEIDILNEISFIDGIDKSSLKSESAISKLYYWIVSKCRGVKHCERSSIALIVMARVPSASPR